MKNERKGMTMAIGVIIAIVVLIVVALAVIAISTGALTKLFGTTNTQQDWTASRADCQAWLTNWCMNNPGVAAPTTWKSISINVGGTMTTVYCNDERLLGTTKTCN